MIVLVCPKKLGALYCNLTELNAGTMTLEEEFMGHNSINFEENEVHISGCSGTFFIEICSFHITLKVICWSHSFLSVCLLRSMVKMQVHWK